MRPSFPIRATSSADGLLSPLFDIALDYENGDIAIFYLAQRRAGEKELLVSDLSGGIRMYGKE